MNKKYLYEFPKVFKQLHPLKNKNIDVDRLRRSSGKKVWWLCKCGHEWQLPPNQRLRGTRCAQCPACSGRVSSPNNNLAIKRPDLIVEWHSKNRGKPEDFCPHSGKKVWWLCSKGHEWEATIDHRSNGRGCPVCRGKRASSERNLAVVFPKIAKEFHPTKNGNLIPDRVMPVSSKKVWWLCKNSHEYYEKICNRTAAGRGCHICRSLAFKRPDIAAEWHLKKNGNLTPKDTPCKSSKMVYWQCSKFDKHIWKASVCNRTGKLQPGCPFCRSSKGEKTIADILDNKLVAYKRQFTFDNCRNKRILPFDFATFSDNGSIQLIEFHGEQHYRPIEYWGGKNKFRKVKKNDMLKTKFCENHGIPFLVISYKDDIQMLLSKFLKKV